MRYLYYCNSTYQLLIVLNLHWHRKNAGFENINDYQADLILLNTFPRAGEIAEIVEKENTFSKVYLLEKTYNKGRLHSLYTFMDMVSPAFFMQDKHHIRKAEIADRYDVITAPKYSLVVDQIWRLNKKAKFDLIEDGTASYDLVIPFRPDSERMEKIRHLVGSQDFNNYRHLYLINPDLYTGINEDRVLKVPKYDDEYFEHIRTLFAGFGNYEDKDMYWLSQFFNNVEFNVMLDGVLQTLSEYKDDLLFVQHPRKHLDNRYGFAETDGSQIWEMQLLNMDDLDNKLFISTHSTGCYSAKMLYDKEPYLILVYRMGERWVTASNEDFDRFLEKFRNSYRQPEKVMFPESMDELKECLAYYKNKTGQKKTDNK